MDKTFFIETWGCQMNDLDTQRIAGQLKLRGYRRVESAADASLVLLNTCSIREKAEKKVYARIGELRAAARRGVRVGVAGCVAQQEGEAILD
ncbi:MAG TPA: tRNA (N6-isopentenyl adenosine(37)-C2)-methylthiotransferase MiaB, partial [Thermoanaerobaculia bacterium]|nr:tRNA (N6-isopentenyl adenosine(37)-C2)-methylthiotransferase MiaB [Thermoanaerobaculia bacterium]